LYGDNALLLAYWTQELLKLGIVVSFPLASEELGHSSLPGQMRRCSPHHGGFTSRVVDALMHVGLLRIQGGATVGVGVQ